MFSKHKTVIGFSFGRKGQVQATSEVKCQLMSFKGNHFYTYTVIQTYDLISKPNVTYGTAVRAEVKVATVLAHHDVPIAVTDHT